MHECFVHWRTAKIIQPGVLKIRYAPSYHGRWKRVLHARGIFPAHKTGTVSKFSICTQEVCALQRVQVLGCRNADYCKYTSTYLVAALGKNLSLVYWYVLLVIAASEMSEM